MAAIQVSHTKVRANQYYMSTLTDYINHFTGECWSSLKQLTQVQRGRTLSAWTADVSVRKKHIIISLSTSCMTSSLQSNHKRAMLIHPSTLLSLDTLWTNRGVSSRDSYRPGIWTMRSLCNLDYSLFTNTEVNTAVYLSVWVQVLKHRDMPTCCLLVLATKAGLKTGYDHVENMDTNQILLKFHVCQDRK